MDIKKDMLYSYYRIRKIIGFLGIFLPILIVVFHGGLLSSISHYYYSRSAVFFIAILSSFGLLLVTYNGHKLDKKKEFFSDNFITHLGGISALLVVLLPTTCNGSYSDIICQSHIYPLFGHDNPTIGIIHLLSAGVFFFTMGYMSIYRFSRTKKKKLRKTKICIYKICGIAVWVSIGIILIEKIVEQFIPSFHCTEYDVFFFETVAIVAFGISWIVKGKAMEDAIELKNRTINYFAK